MNGILLPGWDCPNQECRAFNGCARFELDMCRCCGTARQSAEPNEIDRVRAELKTVYENLTSVQERCASLLLENRQLKLDLIELKARHAFCSPPDQRIK